MTGTPTPDPVAVETLRAAWDTYNLTFAALVIAVIAAVLGGVALWVALADAKNNATQLRLLLEAASKKPKIALTFHDSKTVLRATDFSDAFAQLVQAGGTEQGKASLRVDKHQIYVIFQALNSGNIAVPSAYVRLWLPPGASLKPLDPDADFYYGGPETIDGLEYLRQDFKFGALYPQVDILSYSFELEAPGAASGTIYWRLFTDELYFPEHERGELVFFMPLAKQSSHDE